MTEILAKGTTLFIGHILISASGLLLIPLIIRLGSVETLGLFSLYSSVLSVLYGISSFGAGFRMRRYLPGLNDPIARAALVYPQLWFQCLSLLLLASVTIIAWPIVITIVGGNKPNSTLAPGIILTYLMSQLVYAQSADYFRYTHRTTVYTVATSSTPYLAFTMMAAIYFGTHRITINNIILCQSLGSLCIGSVLMVIAIREIGFNLTFPEMKTLKKDILLGLPLVMAFLVDMLLAASDRFVIGGVLSTKEVGLYVSAYSIGMLIMLIPRMLGVLLPPIIARDMDTGQQKSAETIVDQVARGYIIVSMAFVAWSVVLGKPILSLYASEEVAVAAWSIVPIVAIGAIFYGLMLIYYNVLSVQLRTRDMFHATLMAAALNLILNLVFMPIFKDVLVAAVTTSVTYIIAWIMVWHKVRACWPLAFPVLFLIRALCVAALTGCIAFILYFIVLPILKPLIALLLTLLLTVVAFTLLLGMFKLVPEKLYSEMYSFIFRNRKCFNAQ
jgi:O-antigen/teichoic acid export membrane protein